MTKDSSSDPLNSSVPDIASRLRKASVHAFLEDGSSPQLATDDGPRSDSDRLEALLARTAAVYSHSVTPETRATYARRWRLFEAWCDARSFDSLPAYGRRGDALHLCIAHHRRIASAPAFLQVSVTAVWSKAMGPQGLNYLVHQWCSEAMRNGQYTFTSLRVGMVRSAIRDNEQAHRIATHAGLRSLGSMDRHERREQITRQNVAGQLGP